VDAGPANAYFGLAMLRKLLTLFAIFTGLAAFAAPAEARFAAVDGVRVELAGAATAQCNAVQLAASERPIDVLAHSRADRTRTPHRVMRVYIPTVQIGADRARE
jgi:hypothetical protein